MRQLAIVIAIAALPALASAQTEEEGPEGDVVFVDSSEVEIVVEEEDPGTPFVEHEEEPPPPPQAQAQVNLTVPAPPNVQLNQHALLQQRLAEHPLGGPIVMLAVGIPVAGIFGYAAYLAYHVEDAVDCTFGDCGGEPNRTATAVLGTLAAAGLVLGTVGLISLIIRVGKRGRIRAQYARGELADLATGTIRF